jgi:hypothetical protein
MGEQRSSFRVCLVNFTQEHCVEATWVKTKHIEISCLSEQ